MTARVYKTYYKNQLQAVKVIHRQSTQIKKMYENPETLYSEIIQELNVLDEVKKCPNIVKFNEVLKTSQFILLFFEYCNQGTLNDLVK